VTGSDAVFIVVDGTAQEFEALPRQRHVPRNIGGRNDVTMIADFINCFSSRDLSSAKL
jgi:hypothetical protein